VSVDANDSRKALWFLGTGSDVAWRRVVVDSRFGIVENTIGVVTHAAAADGWRHARKWGDDVLEPHQGILTS